MKKTIDKDMQQKIALGIIVYIIALVVFNNIFIEKINKQTKLAKQRVELAKLQHAQSLAKIAGINQIKEKYAREKKLFEEKRKAFIDENEKKVVLKQIEETGKKYGIKIETVTLAKAEPEITSKLDGTPVVDDSGKSVDMKKYKEYRITMIFKSDYASLAGYLKEIENMEKLVLVQQMELSSDGREILSKILLKCYLVETGGV